MKRAAPSDGIVMRVSMLSRRSASTRFLLTRMKLRTPTTRGPKKAGRLLRFSLRTWFVVFAVISVAIVLGDRAWRRLHRWR